MEDQNIDTFLAYLVLIEESNNQFSQEQFQKLELIRTKVGEILKRVQPQTNQPIEQSAQVSQLINEPTIVQNFMPEKIVYTFKEFTEISEKIEKRGNSWVVLDSTGKKVLGTHPTKEKAVKQLQAIEISKHK